MRREPEPWQVYAFILWLCIAAPLGFAIAFVTVRWARTVWAVSVPLPLILFLGVVSGAASGLSAIGFRALRLTFGRRPDGKVVLAVKPPGFDQAIQAAGVAARQHGISTNGRKAMGQTIGTTWQVFFYKRSQPLVVVCLEQGSHRLIEVRTLEETAQAGEPT